MSLSYLCRTISLSLSNNLISPTISSLQQSHLSNNLISPTISFSLSLSLPLSLPISSICQTFDDYLEGDASFRKELAYCSGDAAHERMERLFKVKGDSDLSFVREAALELCKGRILLRGLKVWQYFCEAAIEGEKEKEKGWLTSRVASHLKRLCSSHCVSPPLVFRGRRRGRWWWWWWWWWWW